MASQKPKYNVFQNTFYLLKAWRRAYPRELLLSALRIPCKVLAPFLGILLPKAVLDCLTGRVSPWTLAAVAGGFTLALCLVQGVDAAVEARLPGAGTLNRLASMRELVWKVLTTDYANLESPRGRQAYDKAFAFTSNGASGSQEIVSGVVEFASALLGFLLYGSVLSTLHPLAAVLLLLLSAVSSLLTRACQRYEYRTRGDRTRQEQRLNYLLQKSGDLGAGKDLRLYGIKRWFSQIFTLALRELIRAERRVQFRWFGAAGLQGLQNFLRDGLAYGYLLFLVLDGTLTVADFTLYFGAVTGFAVWLSQLIEWIGVLNRVSLACCDYRDYLEMEDHPNRDGFVLPEGERGRIRITFDHVTFQYPGSGTPTLENLCFTLEPGEKAALVGRNGAGKTTCVKLLCGFFQPTSGRILLNGREISEFQREGYLKLITAVFQESNVLPMSLWENVALCPEEELDTAKLQRCLERAGLWEQVCALPDRERSMLCRDIFEKAVDFSGGERQKLYLARALYKDSPLLLLDEPTAALDPIAEDQLYQKYRDLTQGKTSLFISHRLASTRFCDKVLYLERGRIAEMGTHEKLLAAGGGYAAMYRLQSHYYRKNLEKKEAGLHVKGEENS